MAEFLRFEQMQKDEQLARELTDKENKATPISKPTTPTLRNVTPSRKSGGKAATPSSKIKKEKLKQLNLFETLKRRQDSVLVKK